MEMDSVSEVIRIGCGREVGRNKIICRKEGIKIGEPCVNMWEVPKSKRKGLDPSWDKYGKSHKKDMDISWIEAENQTVITCILPEFKL